MASTAAGRIFTTPAVRVGLTRRGRGIPRAQGANVAWDPPKRQTHMYHGSSPFARTILWALWNSSCLTGRTPFQQAAGGARQGVVKMVGADAQRVAETASALRDDIPAEDRDAVALLDGRQNHNLGIFEEAAGIDAAHDHFDAYIVGVEAGEIDGGAHGHGGTAGQPDGRELVAGFHETDAVPDLADARSPAGFCPHALIVAFAQVDVLLVGRVV